MRNQIRPSRLLLAGTLLLSVACSPQLRAQSTLPEPVYWSQQLFLIPYKWDSGSTATGASAVKLYLSQDRGQTWNEISQAKPEVQFFNYHAPADGEYWFCMRTIDSAGRTWPDGPYQAELRVIVDTQNPTITSFNAQLRADGTASTVWQASDPNINSAEAQLQYRTPSDTTWRDVPSGSLRTPTAGFLQGDATWQLPAGTSSVWVRLTVRDRANNGREAGAEARIEAAPNAQLASSAYRLPAIPQSSTPTVDAASPPTGRAPQGVPPVTSWTSATTPAPSQYAMQAPSARTSPETWPSDGQSPVPLGSPRPTGGNQLTAPPLDPGRIPSTSGSPTPMPIAASDPKTLSQQPFNSPFQLPGASSSQSSMHTASASPFGTRTPSLDRPAATPPGAHTGAAVPTLDTMNNLPGLRPQPLQSAEPVQHLNSLDFEIGYDVDTGGTYGITRVELWGTPDEGKSWRRLAVDTDNRSPILAAVPAPGDYGLKIVVETAGGIDPVRPRPGDAPEMRVRIDTTPPIARLTGISQGTGASADHLMVQWQGTEHYASGETVSLQYSSHASGPWVTSAANLPNNGQYAWRLARHLPTQFFVRLEVRDQAGNVATDQTQVPVEVTLPTPSGRLGEVRALQ